MVNFCSTGPLTGQVQAAADGTTMSATAHTTIRARRICLLLVVHIANERQDTHGVGCCQYGLQRHVVKLLARKTGQPSDDSGGLTAGHTVGD
jgi:hypothetical protein